jgi:hypothetical protein
MEFQNGDVIIRDNHSYPEGALVVEDTTAAGDLIAYPLGGGFQLTIPARQTVRFSLVPNAEKVAVFRRGLFELEAIEEAFAGWSDGTRWNGCAKPYFEFAEASKIIAALNPPGNYDPATDAFITALDDGEQDVWPSGLIVLPDGGTAKVYGIGAGAWIWEEVDD